MTFDRLNALLFSRYRKWVIKVATELLRQRMDRVGEDDPDTIAAMAILALIHIQQGDYAKAEPLHVACLKKRTALLGENHPDTLRSMTNLADCYKDQGQYDEAETLYETCLKKRKVQFFIVSR